MERAGDFLGIALRKMQDSNAATVWLKARWPGIVGDGLAAHLRPLGCTKGTLFVEADSREWKNQAEAMERELRERVNDVWHGVLVRDVRVQLVRPSRRIPYELDNTHVPFLRKRAKPKP